MTEFLREDEIKKVASAEYPKFRDYMEEVDTISEHLETIFTPEQPIEHYEYLNLIAYIRATEVAGRSVVDRLAVNGLPNDAESFISYVQKRLTLALDRIRNHSIVFEPSQPPIQVSALNIPLYSFAELWLHYGLQLAKKGGDTDFSPYREQFREVKILPAAHFLPELKQELANISAAYPGLLDDQPPLVEQAKLEEIPGIKSEVSALERIISDKLGGTTDISWIKDNPDALVKFLELTQVFEGSRTQKLQNTVILTQLRRALEMLIQRVEELREQKLINAKINELEELDRYDLTETRVQEIFEVIDLILNIEQSPQFEVWRDWTVEGIRLFGSIPNGESLNSFLSRTHGKVDANVQLVAPEAEDLQRVLEYFEAQRELISRLRYSDPNNSGFNNRLEQSKTAYINQRIQEINDLIEANSGLGAGPTRKQQTDVESRIESGNLRVVLGIYQRLREFNPEIPEFETLHPGLFDKFMQELILGINMYHQQVFGRTSSAGNTSRGLPGESTDLWGGEKFVVQDIEGETPLSVFFMDFPWEKIMGDKLTHEEKLHWVNTLWKMRFVAITQRHNYAHAFRDKIEPTVHSPDEPERVRQLIADKVNDGGIQAYDMTYFHKRRYKPGEPLHEILGDEEEYWRVPEIMNFFIHWIEREVPNYSTGDPSTEDALRLVKDDIIARIPEEYRIKDTKGNYRDLDLIENTWMTAIWTMYPTLRIFDYDDGALAYRTSRYINTGEYGPKVTIGRTNSAERWSDTGVQQLNRIWVPRSQFNHAYVELRPEYYKRYTIDDLIQEIEEMEAKIQTATGSQKRQLQRRVKELDKFLIDVRQVSVGEYQDVRGVKGFGKLEERLEELKEIATTPYDQEQYDSFKSYYDYLKSVEQKARTNHEPPAEIDRLIRRAAHRYAINERYVIMRIKPEYTALKGSVTDIKDQLPIRVPVTYFEHAREMSLRNNPKAAVRGAERANFIALSDDQIVKSMIDPGLVRYDSYSPANGIRWAGMAKDMAVWYEFLDLSKKDGVFPPIHESGLSGKIARKTKYFNLPGQMRMTVEQLKAMLPGDKSNSAANLDRYLRNQLTILNIEKDDFTVLMKFDKVTKAGMRYASGKLMRCGPQFEGEEQMSSGELWVEMFRREFQDDGETFTELRNRLDASALKEAKRTYVPDWIRLSADLVFQKDENGNPRRNAALNQMVVEAFMISVGMYLDRYRYKSIEEGHKFPFFADILDASTAQIHTVTPGMKPMDFAHRELFLTLCENALASFLGPDFGGEDFESGQDKKIVRNYTRKFVEQMMYDRGLIGTPEQYLIDMAYYKNEFGKVKQASDKGKGDH
jgi:hypothetical protein